MSSQIPKSRFRSPGNNNILTKALFFETSIEDKVLAVYTLKKNDHSYDGRDYPSLYRLYMETSDPTEWRFAQEHLDGWDQWEVLQGCTWFKEHLAGWRKELDLKVRSESLSRIMREAKTASKESFQANKYLLEKGWEPSASKRGRPTKEEVRQAAREEAAVSRRLNQDLERLQLVRVQ